jgi:hypothetical protein
VQQVQVEVVGAEPEARRSGRSAKCQVPCPKTEIVSPEGRATEDSAVAVMVPPGALPRSGVDDGDGHEVFGEEPDF